MFQLWGREHNRGIKSDLGLKTLISSIHNLTGLEFPQLLGKREQGSKSRAAVSSEWASPVMISSRSAGTLKQRAALLLKNAKRTTFLHSEKSLIAEIHIQTAPLPFYREQSDKT